MEDSFPHNCVDRFLGRWDYSEVMAASHHSTRTPSPDSSGVGVAMDASLLNGSDHVGVIPPREECRATDVGSSLRRATVLAKIHVSYQSSKE
jgi:hypothetical protein